MRSIGSRVDDKGRDGLNSSGNRIGSVGRMMRGVDGWE